MLGIGMIVAGMVIIGATSLLQNRGSRLHLKGVLVALSVALIISLYTLIDGTAVKNGPPLPYALTMFMLVPLLPPPITSAALAGSILRRPGMDRAFPSSSRLFLGWWPTCWH